MVVFVLPGGVSADIPLFIHKTLADNERRRRTAELAVSAKLQGQALVALVLNRVLVSRTSMMQTRA